VERVTYCRFEARAGVVRGVAVTGGVVAPARVWWFPVGCEDPDWNVYLALANPGVTPAGVVLTFYVDDGAPVVRRFTIPGGQRVTHAMHEPTTTANPAGFERAGSVLIETDVPILAERLIYGLARADARPVASLVNARAGQAATLAARRARIFGIADDGTGEDGMLVLVNPSASPVEAVLDCWSDGDWRRVTTATVAPLRRTVVAVAPGLVRLRADNSDLVAEYVVIWRDGAVAGLVVDAGTPDVWSDTDDGARTPSIVTSGVAQ
jgi:hypothetical protein